MNHPLFKTLSQKELERALGYFKRKFYDEGEILAAEGEYCQKAFVLIDGEIIVGDETKTGMDEEVFCAVNLIDRGAVKEEIVSKGASVLEIDHDDFIEMIDEAPEVAVKLLWYLSYEISRELRDCETKASVLFNALNEVVDND